MGKDKPLISLQSLEAGLQEEFLSNRYQSEVYPFDASMCNRCSHSWFERGDTYCTIYSDRCPSVRGCMSFHTSERSVDEC